MCSLLPSAVVQMTRRTGKATGKAPVAEPPLTFKRKAPRDIPTQAAPEAITKKRKMEVRFEDSTFATKMGDVKPLLFQARELMAKVIGVNGGRTDVFTSQHAPRKPGRPSAQPRTSSGNFAEKPEPAPAVINEFPLLSIYSGAWFPHIESFIFIGNTAPMVQFK